jgi:hypothetical protein
MGYRYNSIEFMENLPPPLSQKTSVLDYLNQTLMETNSYLVNGFFGDSFPKPGEQKPSDLES